MKPPVCTCRTVFNLNHIPEGVNPAGCPLHDATLAEMERGMKLLEKMDQPITVTLRSGDWDVVLGLVTGEWSNVIRQDGREAYAQTLSHIRQTIIRRNS